MHAQCSQGALSDVLNVQRVLLCSLHHKTLSLICVGDALHAAVEDDIERELAALGITLNKRVLSKEDFNAAMTSGDFHMVFSETWGAPYDPVSYITGWMANDEAHYSAMAGLTGLHSRANTFAKIDLALREADPEKRAEIWAESPVWGDDKSECMDC